MKRISADTLRTLMEATADGVALRVKVVPGASRTKIAGVLGERLKVTVAAAPQAGQANQAVCKLLADTFGVHARDVRLTAGQTQPLKTIAIDGLTLCDAVERLTKLLGRTVS